MEGLMPDTVCMMTSALVRHGSLRIVPYLLNAVGVQFLF